MDGADEHGSRATQDQRYVRAMEQLGPAIERISRAYEADADLQKDLLQDIHFAIWRSFAGFDGRCAESTWVYRVAHNVAATHVLRRSRSRAGRMVTLDELADLWDPSQPDPETETGERQALKRLTALVRALGPPDRQVVVLYLEGLDGARIAEICGLTPGAVATKVHRLKAVLAQRFQQGGGHGR